MKTLIIEDDPNQQKELERLITNLFPEFELVESASSVEEASQQILKHSPSLVISDIMLGNQTCFDIFDKMESIPFEIIFATGHDDFALRALKMNAIDYLLKPIDSIDLKNALDKYKKKENLKGFEDRYQELSSSIKSQKLNKIVVSNLTEFEVVDVSDIVRCEADKNYTEIYLKNNKKILACKTIKEFEEMLEPNNFFRIHRAHLINLQCVKKYIKGATGSVELDNGENIFVARRRKDELIAKLGGTVG